MGGELGWRAVSDLPEGWNGTRETEAVLQLVHDEEAGSASARPNVGDLTKCLTLGRDPFRLRSSVGPSTRADPLVRRW